MGRNKTDLNVNKNGQKDNKTSTTITTKTEIKVGNNDGKLNKLQINRNNRSITEQSGTNDNKNNSKVSIISLCSWCIKTIRSKK